MTTILYVAYVLGHPVLIGVHWHWRAQNFIMEGLYEFGERESRSSYFQCEYTCCHLALPHERYRNQSLYRFRP